MTSTKRFKSAPSHRPGPWFGCAVASVALIGAVGCVDELTCKDTFTCKHDGGAGGEANATGGADGAQAAGAEGADTEVGGSSDTEVADPSSSGGSDRGSGGATTQTLAGANSGLAGDTTLGGAAGAPAGSQSGGAAGAPAGSQSGGAAEAGATGTTRECEPNGERSCVEAGLHGPCAEGTQVCGSEGSWGQCSILPGVEDTCEEGNDANCNGTPNEGCACTAGSTRPCDGAEGDCAAGLETCLDDGSGWSACSIEPESADSCEPGNDANCNGLPNEGCPCMEGDTQACGPEDEIGICRAGLSTCTADGTWGLCEGAANAKARDCRSHEDNDCDGLPDDTVDDTCKCTVGDTQPCQSHPGRDGIGICKAGSQTCVALQYGKTSDWGACSDSIGPKARDCGSSDDNDCDGIPDSGTGGPAFVKLPEGYCIDSTEVTRGQYQAWLDAEPSTNGQADECSWNVDFEPSATCMGEPGICETDCSNHPQVCVDWCDAYAYCKAVDKRLCGKIGGGPAPHSTLDDDIESQWYNACTGNGANLYPYGNEYIPDACNGRGLGEGTTVAAGSVKTCQAAVGSGYEGVFDLSGNVMEWEDACTPTGDCWMRGGAYWDGVPDRYLKCSGGGIGQNRRDPASFTGFRCCSP